MSGICAVSTKGVAGFLGGELESTVKIYAEPKGVTVFFSPSL